MNRLFPSLAAVAVLLIGAARGWAEDRYFDAAGVRVRYVELGPNDAEAVVLVHGISRDLELTWADTGILDRLAQTHRTIALDCRGHGQSDKPKSDDKYGIEMVYDVVRLLDHLDIERAHVVGYSMGGRIALKLAATHPSRVRSVVLLGAGGSRPEDNHRLWDDVARSLESGEGIRPLLAKILPDLPEEQIRAINDETLARNDAAALAAVARNYRAFATSDEELDRVTVPVLAVIGSDDAFRPDVEALAARLPELKVVIIEGADHVTALTRPQLLAAVADFLKD